MGQREDLTHHVHVVRYQQGHLQDLRLRRLEEELLGLRRLRDGDDEHEVVLAAAEGDDVGVGELLGDLHGGVVQHGDALLVDGQPDQALVNLTLNRIVKISSCVCQTSPVPTFTSKSVAPKNCHFLVQVRRILTQSEAVFPDRPRHFSARQTSISSRSSGLRLSW